MSASDAGPLEGLEVRLATPDDLPAVRRLLADAALPHADVAPGAQDLLVALERGTLVACAGLEIAGTAGLLRSFAVAPERRGAGLGSALYDRVVARARERGVTDAYLLTTTAERFFAARGFDRIDRAEVPGAVAALPEFRSLCPASAVCMRRSV